MEDTKRMSSSSDSDSDSAAPDLVPLPNAVSSNALTEENEHRTEKRSSFPCPVTIICGWLGSGKTTLLKHLLANISLSTHHPSSTSNGNNGTKVNNWRVAIIENEFSDAVGAEDAMIVQYDSKVDNESQLSSEGVSLNTSQVYSALSELRNGCICCTMKGDLVIAIESLMEKSSIPYDWIVIETTGLADPGPLASVFWLDEQLEAKLRLDAIVTVVDGSNVLDQLSRQENTSSSMAQDAEMERQQVKEHLKKLRQQVSGASSEPVSLSGGGGYGSGGSGSGGRDAPGPSCWVNEVARQIAFADILVINKLDLITKEHLENVHDVLNRLNPTAKRLISCHSVVDVDSVIGVNVFNRDHWDDTMTMVLNQGNERKVSTHRDGEHQCSHPDCCTSSISPPHVSFPSHLETISHVSFRERGVVSSLRALEMFLGELLWSTLDISGSHYEIYRVKGCVFIDNELSISKRYIQGVGQLFEIGDSVMTSTAERESKAEAVNVLVFIGRGLVASSIQQNFKRILRLS